MDAAIQNIFSTLKGLGLEQDTLVVITSDHGETLYEHDCYFDHHSIYDCVLRVPLVLRFPGNIAAGQRHGGTCQLKDIMPTVLDLMGIESGIDFDGRSLVPLLRGESREPEPEFYITECTWMRKHGWRTPEWKLIHALEPDFHFKPEVELYNLVRDPGETVNLAQREPETVAYLEARMQSHIRRREQETGRTNPMQTNLDWHGKECGPFKTPQQAYDTLYIGDTRAARKLQAREEGRDKG
jgi:arylsulfatase A-like enzyme